MDTMAKPKQIKAINLTDDKKSGNWPRKSAVRVAGEKLSDT